MVHIITLCGSTKFKKAYEFFNAYHTMKGSLVFSVALFFHDHNVMLSDTQKLHLDRIHFGKILASDEIYVLDEGGYIGESTRAEIEWATLNLIPIKYMSEDFPYWADSPLQTQLNNVRE